MNVRERFLEVMLNFDKHVTPPKWEFGYWGGTVDNWYASGLPKILCTSVGVIPEFSRAILVVVNVLCPGYEY